MENRTNKWMKSIKHYSTEKTYDSTINIGENPKFKKKEEKNKQDKNIRFGIQKIIRNNIKEGKSLKEIISILQSNSEFLKYEIYFKNWIEDDLRKIEKSNEIER